MPLPADTDTEVESATGQHVDRCQLLGGCDGRSVRENENGESQPQVLGARSEELQGADGIEPTHVRRGRERSVVGVGVLRRHVGRPADMVRRPTRVEPQPVHFLREAHERLAADIASQMRKMHAPIHGQDRSRTHPQISSVGLAGAAWLTKFGVSNGRRCALLCSENVSVLRHPLSSSRSLA